MHEFQIFGLTISPEKYEHLLAIPQEKLFSWLEAGLNILPNFIVAIITLLLFYPFAKLAKWLAGKIFRRTTDNQAVHDLYKNIVFLVVFLIGVFSALEILNLEKTVTSLLAGAGVLGLALGFAFQEIASNFVSGILITSRKPYHVGDIVEVQNKKGRVKSIELRTTTLMTSSGVEIIVPNKQMIIEPLINYTSTPELRIEIPIGVSYDDDLKKVTEVAKKAVANLPHLLKNRDIDFNCKTFGPSSIDCRLDFWIDYKGGQNEDESRHEAVINLKKAFDENGFTIPYPIQTVDMSMANKQSKNT